VNSAADDCVARALVCVIEAITNLRQIVDEEAWGWADYTPQYREDVEAALSDLRAIRKNLRAE